MSDGRKRLSGAQYKKIAEEKRKKQDDAVRSSKKIDSFFQRYPAVNESEEVLGAENSSDEQQQAISLNVEGNESEESESTAMPSSEIENSAATNFVSSVDTIKPDRDPAKWDINDFTINYFAINGFESHKQINFSQSKRIYSDQARYLNPTIFTRKLINGEETQRTWLIYSESTGRIFCGACRLFKIDTYFATTGFDDWKNVNTRVNQHESSHSHKSSMLNFKLRGSLTGSIDKMLFSQVDEEINYWKEVLRRVFSVVRKLTSRGLPLRGRDEIIGSSSNGNFLMAMELIAEFDPFLAEHIRKYNNPGSGQTSYMSSSIYEEFVAQLAKEIRSIIVNEVKTSKYFSIIVDSSPDLAHMDQLSFVIRYVQENGNPVERFLFFLPNTSHKAEELTKAILDTLLELGIPISNCRGQSYDNASNMSGIYTGVQARIKEINPRAEFIPCAAHSLNLVGNCAASSCSEAVYFFSLIQELYNFFALSTRRWQRLCTNIEKKLTLKSLSLTRWSSRDDACRSLIRSWKEIINTLRDLENDINEKNLTRIEAKGLRNRLLRLETAIMAVCWEKILHRINATSKKLQAIDIDISSVLDLYSSLIEYLKSIRNDFDNFERDAKNLTDSDYEINISRTRKRKLQFDENREDYVVSNTDKFRIGSFFVIVDRLCSELEKRRSAYNSVYCNYKILCDFQTLTNDELRTLGIAFCEHYSDDVEEDFIEECIHLREHLKCTNTSVKNLCHWISSNNYIDVYPNVYVALRMFKSTAVTNCSAERSFSCLRRIKNYLRSNMTEGRLNDLSILTIESDILERVPFDTIITNFAKSKVRRKVIL